MSSFTRCRFMMEDKLFFRQVIQKSSLTSRTGRYDIHNKGRTGKITALPKTEVYRNGSEKRKFLPRRGGVKANLASGLFPLRSPILDNFQKVLSPHNSLSLEHMKLRPCPLHSISIPWKVVSTRFFSSIARLFATSKNAEIEKLIRF